MKDVYPIYMYANECFIAMCAAAFIGIMVEEEPEEGAAEENEESDTEAGFRPKSLCRLCEIKRC